MRVIRSKKLRALQQAYGRPWWETATDWAGRALTQREIAAAWSAAVSGESPGVRFVQQDVQQIVHRAVARQLECDPESVKHLIDGPVTVKPGEPVGA